MCLLCSRLLHIFCSHFLLCIPLPPSPLFFYTFSHCVCQFLSLSLSLSLPFCLSPPFASLFFFSLFFLVSFEVLNNERAALPVKLIEKSRLKLLGTVHHSWILSSGPHVDVKGGGSIWSVVSMRWQWLHRALIPLAETQTTSAQHSWWFPENVSFCLCCSECWTLTTFHFLTQCIRDFKGVIMETKRFACQDLIDCNDWDKRFN